MYSDLYDNTFQKTVHIILLSTLFYDANLVCSIFAILGYAT